MPADGRKVKGTIHWVSASECENVTVNLYDNLFNIENTREKGIDINDYLNPNSLTVLENCKAEKALADAKAGDTFQFVRTGYFCKDSRRENTFGLTVGLKDSYKENK